MEAQELASSGDFQAPVYTNISKDYTINMAWHNVTTAAANDTVLSTIASTKGLTTISPTWFTIGDNDGNLDSIASAEYVNYAHQSGLEVWGMIDNFKEGVDTYEVLSYTSKPGKSDHQAHCPGDPVRSGRHQRGFREAEQ